MEDTNTNNIPEKEQKISPQAPIYVTTKNPPLYYAPIADDPKLKLKKELRSVANKACSGVLLLYVCGVLFQIAITILAFIFMSKGEVIYNEFLGFINTPTFNLLFNSFYQAIFMTLPFIVAGVISKQRPSDILCYSKPKNIIPLSILGLGGAMLCNLANIIIHFVFSLFGSTLKGSNLEMNCDMGSFFLNIITVAVIPALFEEFAFRGMLMGLLRKRFSTSASIIISAAAFGLIHGNFVQIPFAFLIGLILGYLYAATGSLWVPMLVHFLNNAYSIVIDHITYNMPTSASNIVFYTSLCILLLSGIIAFIYIIKTNPETLNYNDNKKDFSNPEMLKIGFTSPVFIISAVFFLIDAVTNQIGGVI